MKRRKFLRQTAIGSTLPFWLNGCDLVGSDYPIQVRSDHDVGHLIMESQSWPISKNAETETLIVGGGLAGMAAAYSLKDKDFQLLELSDRLGGTAGSVLFEGNLICQGAHYDLDYPDYYGSEVLQLLEELKIVRYEPWKKLWSFVDQQHLIPASRRQQCYENGKIRGDVIPESDTKRRFLEIISEYEGQLPLPTRLLAPEFRNLDDLSFRDFLQDKIDVTPQLERQLDYHMMDDYGGLTKQVSALAGLYYFACRPYYRKHVQLFSPPSGNSFFVEKILQQVPDQRIKTGRLVFKIEWSNSGFEVWSLDVKTKSIEKWKAGRVIYAGQKHALKYIFPKDYPAFDKNEYAPWMVINFVCKEEGKDYGFWQNEYLGEDKSFLGFIDSSVQSSTLSGKRVYTAYYCLEPKDREYLTTIPAESQKIVGSTQQKIEDFLGRKINPLKAFVNVMGHAMPIPGKGYLFKERAKTDLNYAGVDTGRLPLLFEALDSGLFASA